DSRIRDGTTADDEMTISIHYGDLEYENVEEISVSTLSRFISELGGQANLFVGMSILVFVHVFTDFLVWLSTYFIKVCKKET
ncbi:Protein DEL-7, partial [Aphelenchoides avenae]